MKKLYFLTLLLSLFILASCETSENELIDSKQNISLEKLVNFKTMKKSEQKITYQLLNKEEKLELWKDRFSQILLIINLNKNQEEAINVLNKNLNSDFFDLNNTSQNTSAKEYVKGWVIKNEVKFKKDDFAYYFANLSDLNLISQMRNGLVTEIGDGEDDCECNELEDYCIGSSFECKKARCKKKYGCGFLWNSSCNGECEQKPF